MSRKGGFTLIELMIVVVLIGVLAVIVIGQNIQVRKLAESSQAAVVQKGSITADSAGVVRLFQRDIAVHDSLLALNGAFLNKKGNWLGSSVYIDAGQALLRAVQRLEQAGTQQPFVHYVGLADLARGTWNPRYRQFQGFIYDDGVYGDGHDWQLVALMGSSYATVLERGFGSMLRAAEYAQPVN